MGLAAVVVTVAASLGLAALLDALPAVRRLVLPRSADEWLRFRQGVGAGGQ